MSKIKNSAIKPVAILLATILMLSFKNNLQQKEPVQQNDQVQQEMNKPNILFIFTDDEKSNSIHALGNKEIITPNIDKLVDGAFVFNNAYCFGGNSAAVCVPSRNMLMTGKTFFRFEADVDRLESLGKETRKKQFANPDWATIPKSMHAAGYQTFYREKSGVSNNPIIREQFDDYADINEIEALKSGRPGKKIVDEALTFLKDRDHQQPFFMYLGFPAPHDPRWSLKKYRDLYKQEELTLPDNFEPEHQWDIGDLTVRDEALEKWPRTKEAIQRHIFDYYAVMTAMDDDIGRLIDGLKAMNLEENTIIVFSSDQGIALGEHGLMGKQNIYEGTMKVPLFIKGPGISKGTSNALVYLHDLFPTFCEMAHIKIPDSLDGKSMLSIIEGKEQGIRNDLMLAYKDVQRSVRDNRYKLIHYPKIGKSMLFDLKNDPDERNNLTGKKAYQQVERKMFDLLEKERKRLGDKIDLFPTKLEQANFIYPKEKLKTPYPAGGLAPDDPSYKATE